MARIDRAPLGTATVMSVLSAAERLAAALARWRGARLLHPAGRTFSGKVTIGGAVAPVSGVALLDRPGRYPATIRFSRGVPTPAGWPDVLGLAVRIHLGADRQPFDLLVSSSGTAPVLRQLPLPRRRVVGGYSTIMPYRSGRGRLWLGVLPDRSAVDLGRGLDEVAAATRRDTPRLVLAVASAVGPWRPFGVVCVDEPLDCATDAALAFDPVGNLPAGLWAAAGPVARLRDRTYRGSRRARGASARSAGPAAASAVQSGGSTDQSGGSTATTV
ncbi:hypothetical protein GA0074694_0066 [Micromonospora inyonensis]|uniref:Phosphodiesterase n=2 Tax=Micromonospora inyonensis TaxID=47866 RepID=A0A1C6R7R9_9ACTN|nr:hypothetical protein GA0074694_0066 [Micromonospora inyonensis]